MSKYSTSIYNYLKYKHFFTTVVNDDRIEKRTGSDKTRSASNKTRSASNKTRSASNKTNSASNVGYIHVFF